MLFNVKPALLNINKDKYPENNTTGYKSWKEVCVEKKSTVFSFRIPKKDMQQLKYIAAHTGLSINTLCLMSIQAHNRKTLKEIEDAEAL